MEDLSLQKEKGEGKGHHHEMWVLRLPGKRTDPSVYELWWRHVPGFKDKGSQLKGQRRTAGKERRRQRDSLTIEVSGVTDLPMDFSPRL